MDSFTPVLLQPVSVPSKETSGRWPMSLGFTLCRDVPMPQSGSFSVICDMKRVRDELTGPPSIRIGMHVIRMSDDLVVDTISRQPIAVGHVIAWRERSDVAPHEPIAPGPDAQADALTDKY